MVTDLSGASIVGWYVISVLFLLILLNGVVDYTAAMFSKVTTATIFARRLREEPTLERQGSQSGGVVFPPKKRDTQIEAAFDRRKNAVRNAMDYLTEREREETGGEWDVARRKLEADRAKDYLAEKEWEREQEALEKERESEKDLLYQKQQLENERLEKEQAAVAKRERQRQQELDLQRQREYLMHTRNYDDTGLLWPPTVPIKMRHPSGSTSREESLEYYSSDSDDEAGKGAKGQASTESQSEDEPVIMGHLQRAMLRAEERATEQLTSRPEGHRPWKSPETTAEIHHYGVRTLPISTGTTGTPITNPQGQSSGHSSSYDQLTTPEGQSGDELSSNDEGRKVHFGKKSNGQGIKSSRKASGSSDNSGSTEGILKNNGKSDSPGGAHGGARPKTKLCGANVEDKYNKKKTQGSKSGKLSPRPDHKDQQSPQTSSDSRSEKEKKTDKTFGFTLGQSDIERGYLHHMGLDVLAVDPDDSTRWKEKIERHEKSIRTSEKYPLPAERDKITMEICEIEPTEEKLKIVPSKAQQVIERNIMEVPGNLDGQLEEITKQFRAERTKSIDQMPGDMEEGDDRDEGDRQRRSLSRDSSLRGSDRRRPLKSPKTTRQGPILVPPSVMKEAIKSHGSIGVMTPRVGIPEEDAGKPEPGTVLIKQSSMADVSPVPGIDRRSSVQSSRKHSTDYDRKESSRSRNPSGSGDLERKGSTKSVDLQRKGSGKSEESRSLGNPHPHMGNPHSHMGNPHPHRDSDRRGSSSSSSRSKLTRGDSERSRGHKEPSESASVSSSRSHTQSQDRKSSERDSSRDHPESSSRRESRSRRESDGSLSSRRPGIPHELTSEQKSATSGGDKSKVRTSNIMKYLQADDKKDDKGQKSPNPGRQKSSSSKSDSGASLAPPVAPVRRNRSTSRQRHLERTPEFSEDSKDVTSGSPTKNYKIGIAGSKSVENNMNKSAAKEVKWAKEIERGREEKRVQTPERPKRRRDESRSVERGEARHSKERGRESGTRLDKMGTSKSEGSIKSLTKPEPIREGIALDKDAQPPKRPARRSRSRGTSADTKPRKSLKAQESKESKEETSLDTHDKETPPLSPEAENTWNIPTRPERRSRRSDRKLKKSDSVKSQISGESQATDDTSDIQTKPGFESVELRLSLDEDDMEKKESKDDKYQSKGADYKSSHGKQEDLSKEKKDKSCSKEGKRRKDSSSTHEDSPPKEKDKSSPKESARKKSSSDSKDELLSDKKDKSSPPKEYKKRKSSSSETPVDLTPGEKEKFDSKESTSKESESKKDIISAEKDISPKEGRRRQSLTSKAKADIPFMDTEKESSPQTTRSRGESKDSSPKDQDPEPKEEKEEIAPTMTKEKRGSKGPSMEREQVSDRKEEKSSSEIKRSESVSKSSLPETELDPPSDSPGLSKSEVKSVDVESKENLPSEEKDQPTSQISEKSSKRSLKKEPSVEENLPQDKSPSPPETLALIEGTPEESTKVTIISSPETGPSSIEQDFPERPPRKIKMKKKKVVEEKHDFADQPVRPARRVRSPEAKSPTVGSTSSLRSPTSPLSPERSSSLRSLKERHVKKTEISSPTSRTPTSSLSPERSPSLRSLRSKSPAKSGGSSSSLRPSASPLSPDRSPLTSVRMQVTKFLKPAKEMFKKEKPDIDFRKALASAQKVILCTSVDVANSSLPKKPPPSPRKSHPTDQPQPAEKSQDRQDPGPDIDIKEMQPITRPMIVNAETQTLDFVTLTTESPSTPITSEHSTLPSLHTPLPSDHSPQLSDHASIASGHSPQPIDRFLLSPARLYGDDHRSLTSQTSSQTSRDNWAFASGADIKEVSQMIDEISEKTLTRHPRSTSHLEGQKELNVEATKAQRSPRRPRQIPETKLKILSPTDSGGQINKEIGPIPRASTEISHDQGVLTSPLTSPMMSPMTLSPMTSPSGSSVVTSPQEVSPMTAPAVTSPMTATVVTSPLTATATSPEPKPELKPRRKHAAKLANIHIPPADSSVLPESIEPQLVKSADHLDEKSTAPDVHVIFRPDDSKSALRERRDKAIPINQALADRFSTLRAGEELQISDERQPQAVVQTSPQQTASVSPVHLAMYPKGPDRRASPGQSPQHERLQEIKASEKTQVPQNLEDTKSEALHSTRKSDDSLEQHSDSLASSVGSSVSFAPMDTVWSPGGTRPSMKPPYTLWGEDGWVRTSPERLTEHHPHFPNHAPIGETWDSRRSSMKSDSTSETDHRKYDLRSESESEAKSDSELLEEREDVGTTVKSEKLDIVSVAKTDTEIATDTNDSESTLPQTSVVSESLNQQFQTEGKPSDREENEKEIDLKRISDVEPEIDRYLEKVDDLSRKLPATYEFDPTLLSEIQVSDDSKVETAKTTDYVSIDEPTLSEQVPSHETKSMLQENISSMNIPLPGEKVDNIEEDTERILTAGSESTEDRAPLSPILLEDFSEEALTDVEVEPKPTKTPSRSYTVPAEGESQSPEKAEELEVSEAIPEEMMDLQGDTSKEEEDKATSITIDTVSTDARMMDVLIEATLEDKDEDIQAASLDKFCSPETISDKVVEDLLEGMSEGEVTRDSQFTADTVLTDKTEKVVLHEESSKEDVLTEYVTGEDREQGKEIMSTESTTSVYAVEVDALKRVESPVEERVPPTETESQETVFESEDISKTDTEVPKETSEMTAESEKTSIVTDKPETAESILQELEPSVEPVPEPSGTDIQPETSQDMDQMEKETSEITLPERETCEEPLPLTDDSKDQLDETRFEEKKTPEMARDSEMASITTGKSEILHSQVQDSVEGEATWREDDQSVNKRDEEKDTQSGDKKEGDKKEELTETRLPEKSIVSGAIPESSEGDLLGTEVVQVDRQLDGDMFINEEDGLNDTTADQIGDIHTEVKEGEEGLGLNGGDIRVEAPGTDEGMGLDREAEVGEGGDPDVELLTPAHLQESSPSEQVYMGGEVHKDDKHLEEMDELDDDVFITEEEMQKRLDEAQIKLAESQRIVADTTEVGSLELKSETPEECKAEGPEGDLVTGLAELSREGSEIEPMKVEGDVEIGVGSAPSEWVEGMGGEKSGSLESSTDSFTSSKLSIDSVDTVIDTQAPLSEITEDVPKGIEEEQDKGPDYSEAENIQSLLGVSDNLGSKDPDMSRSTEDVLETPREPEVQSPQDCSDLTTESRTASEMSKSSSKSTQEDMAREVAEYISNAVAKDLSQSVSKGTEQIVKDDNPVDENNAETVTKEIVAEDLQDTVMNKSVSQDFQKSVTVESHDVVTDKTIVEDSETAVTEDIVTEDVNKTVCEQSSVEDSVKESSEEDIVSHVSESAEDGASGVTGMVLESSSADETKVEKHSDDMCSDKTDKPHTVD